MEYTTPPSYGSTVVSVGGIAREGEIICAGAAHSATHTELKRDPEVDWPEPRAVKFEWTGKTKDGKEVNAEVAGPLGLRLDRVDVMAEVPKFVKSIVGGVVGTKPYIYQVRAVGPILKYILTVSQYAPQQRLSMKIRIGDDEEKMEEGTLFTEATFIS